MSGPIVLHVAAVEFTASHLLRPQLTYLASLGYDVRLACAPEGKDFVDELVPFDPIRLAFPRSMDPLQMAKAAIDLRRVVRCLRPALVHFHSPAASMPGRAVLAMNARRPRLVYTVHGFLHTWDSRSLRDRAIDQAERVLSRCTDALLFQSSEDYAHAREAGYHGRLVPLGNGIADEWFDVVRSPPRDRFLHVVFVGRLTREKGVGDLLEAVAQVGGVRLTIIGDALPSDRDSVVAQVARASAESAGRINAVGMIPPESVRAHLARSDLLLLPSWREGVPRSVIEGMAAGLPVIATNIRGCRELVQPGVNGWLVPARDSSALAAAIQHAIDVPRENLEAMGRVGREKAWQWHREYFVFERIAAVYRALRVLP